MVLKEAAGTMVPTLPLNEFAEHLRLGYGFADDGAQDGLMDRALKAATAAIENRLGLALVARRFELQVSQWSRDRYLVFPTGPVTALVSMRFLMGAASIDVPVPGLEVDAQTSRQRLSRTGGGALAPIPDGYLAEIVFDAGLGADWSAVPADLKRAVIVLAAALFEAPGAAAGEVISATVEALTAPWRPVRV